MHALGIGQTDIGKKREINEDRFLVDNALAFFAVCDGMGGHSAGDVAAAIAVEALEREVRDRRSTLQRVAAGRSDPAALVDLVAEATLAAGREVYRLATSKPSCAGMGCTATALVVVGGKAAMAHVGDTRLYLCRGDSVHQLSTDHTMVEELARSGALTPEQTRGHPLGHVLTRAIGPQESVRVDTLLFDVVPGDRLLLCSDGLSNHFDDSERWARQLAGDDFESIPESLVAFANAAGGEDNITAVVVRVEADPEERPLALALSSEVEVKLEALSEVFLFEDLTLAQLARVLNACEVESYGAGDTVLHEGEPCGRLLVVVEGRFTVGSGGQVSAELGAGDYVGETTLLRRRPSRAALRALDDGRLLALEGEAFRALARERPWLGVALLERLARWLSLGLDRGAARGEKHSADPAPLLGL